MSKRARNYGKGLGEGSRRRCGLRNDEPRLIKARQKKVPIRTRWVHIRNANRTGFDSSGYHPISAHARHALQVLATRSRH